MIEPKDVVASDLDLSRRVIAVSRVFAPCLPNLAGGPRDDALAILRGVARDVQARSSSMVTSQGVGSARVAYIPTRDWLSDEDVAALRLICSEASRSGLSPYFHPVGHFPRPHKAFTSLWPEEEE